MVFLAVWTVTRRLMKPFVYHLVIRRDRFEGNNRSFQQHCHNGPD